MFLPLASKPTFSEQDRSKFREELLAQGTEIDPYLAQPKGLPQTFGLNLACSWPFPAEAREAYREFAQALSLVPGLRIYPPSDTHITIATFISFTKYCSPTSTQLADLEQLVARVLELCGQTATEDSAQAPFVLRPEPPVLTRRACFIPWQDPSGTIAEMRCRWRNRLEQHPDLLADLRAAGLNMPGIIHSTVARFAAWSDPAEVISAFQASLGAFRLPGMLVSELLITTEIRPYMVAGAVRRRISLQGPFGPPPS